MLTPEQLAGLEPDRVFDGGALDCGSGLVLLIRENMLPVPDAGVLEIRSVERSVRDDLPPWCRMVGHEFLGALPGASPEQARYFVRRGGGAAMQQEAAALEQDKQRARDYQWRLRARSSAPLETSVYCRNFQWRIGQPASFEEQDANPSAIESLVGALAGDLVTGFAVAASRAGLQVDDIELTARARLHDVTAHLGLVEGDPSIESIEARLFASTFDDEARVRAVWDQTVRRSPLAATLRKATRLHITLAIV
ncbi:MAG: sulfurtransferase TusA family protein [Planctomycetota bacterium]